MPISIRQHKCEANNLPLKAQIVLDFPTLRVANQTLQTAADDIMFVSLNAFWAKMASKHL